MQLNIFNLKKKKKKSERNIISLEEFYREKTEEKQLSFSTFKVSEYEKKVFEKNKNYWENGKKNNKLDNNIIKLIPFEHNNSYQDEENFNEYNNLNTNKYFDNIINIICKEIFYYPYEKNIFSYYQKHNKDKFTNYERKKVKKYLKRFFMFRKNPIILKLNKSYNKINKQIIKLCNDIHIRDISNYEEFMNYGNIYYNLQTELLPNINIKKEFEELNNLKDNKKIKVTTPEIDELKSKRRKLLNKIKKIELLEEKKEILLYKKMVLDTENEIKVLKTNNELFKNSIEYSNEIRKNNANKSLETYMRRYEKGKIKENIVDYFGEEQIKYFKSLGIYKEDKKRN